MIRRKVSNGLLRAATSVQSASTTTGSSAAHAVGSSPMQQQTANLASSVLLSSQRNWKGETVVTLKNELKKRGLSQTGNKTTLVARLSSAEASQLLPPMPKSSNASTRTMSTTSPRSASSSNSNSNSKPTPKEKDTATVSADKELTTGPEISSKTAEAEAFEEPTKEQLAAAPGLPESGKVEPSSGERMSMKLPGPHAEQSTEQVIPLEPDNFHSNDKIPEASQTDKSDDVPSPKVMTVASASTHLSGGPVSAVHESSDSADMDEKAKSKDDTPNFEGAGKALASMVNRMTGVGKTTSEFSRVFIPEIHLPKQGKGDDAGGEYKAPKGGLDQDERRGLWVLGGIVGLGLVLGGGSKGDKNGSGLGKKIGHAVDAAKGKTGPQGDKEWEKASGAGVVGHGSRKE